MRTELKCLVDGCEKHQHSKGYCEAHYRRMKKYGDPLRGGLLKRQGAICKVDGCENKATLHDYCRNHYQMWKKNGSPLIRKSPKGDAQTFYRDVLLPFAGDECLTWPFSRDGDGYGKLWMAGKNGKAHRFACIDMSGPPPFEDAEVAHSCGNGHLGCVNPKHLRWATTKENADDRAIHGRNQIGAKNVNSKLTEDDVREIRRLYGSMSQEAISQKFGVSQAAISATLIGRTWKHVK